LQIQVFQGGGDGLSAGPLRFRFNAPTFRQRIARFAERLTGSARPESSMEDDVLALAAGDRAFACLSPVFGKTFTIVLPSINRRGVTLFISPLRALSRDQDVPLRIYTPPDRRPVSIHYTDLEMGNQRLLFISPGSLLARSFREDLKNLVGEDDVHGLLINQVHAVSEWSGDFRPAYRMLPRIMSDLRKIHPRIAILGLTGTCDMRIRRDVIRFLNLAEIAMAPSQPDCRLNLSFRCMRVNQDGQKHRACKELMRVTLPHLMSAARIPPEAACPEMPDPDPYAAWLSAEKSDMDDVLMGPSTDVLCTHSAKEGHPWAMLDTSLGGRLSEWLGAGSQADPEQPFIAFRVVDLPTPRCEADLLSRRTRIPSCQDCTCPMGRESLCDYGKHHHLIQNTFPQVEAELEIMARILDQILDGHARAENPVIIPYDPRIQKQTDLALHRLSMFRIIHLFFIEFRDNPACYKVYGFQDPKQATSRLTSLKGYLAPGLDYSGAYPNLDEGGFPEFHLDHAHPIVSPDPDPEPFSRCAADLPQELRHLSSHPFLFCQIAECLRLLIAERYDSLREMAYRRIWHIKQHATQPTCRYEDLLGRIIAVHGDWRCGVCDNCDPDGAALGRPKESGERPSIDLAVEQALQDRLMNADAPFDATEMDNLIQDCSEHTQALLHRAGHILEEDPYNIKVLYLVRELSDGPQRDMATVDLLSAASRKLTPRQVMRLMNTGRVSPELRQVLFDILDHPAGVMADPEGEQWLYAEARALGLPSLRVSLLGARTVLNHLAQADLPRHLSRLHHIATHDQGNQEPIHG